jgi:KUP system potassium uptake protein
VNWFLLLAVLFIMYQFGESSRLAAAYGLAVNGDMVLTGFLMTWIFILRRNRLKAFMAIFVVCVVLVFLFATVHKVPHGGYWSLIIAALPFVMILIFTQGQKRLYRSLRPMLLDDFLERYRHLRAKYGKSTGTALFFARDAKFIPPYIVNTMFSNAIIYEDNIIVSVIQRDDPFGVTGYFKEELAPGLRTFEIQTGYMELLDVERILDEAGIDAKTIFYGIEDISTKSVIWTIFSVIKRLTPAFVQFYKLPSHKLHGIVTRVEM